VHRDVKPDNIFLSEEAPAYGDAKIGDFGIAAIIETSRPGTRAGTPDYMSPEVITGRGADVRSDIYSLGVTMYELLVGAKPFDPKLSDLAFRTAIAQGESRPISAYSHVDRRLQQIVQKAMNVDPDQRYQSGAELASAIESAHVDLAVDAELAGRAAGAEGIVLQRLSDLCEEFATHRRPWIELVRLLGVGGAARSRR